MPLIGSPFKDKLADYRFGSQRLREYAGWHSQWRPLAGVGIVLGLLLLPVVGGVASIYLSQRHNLIGATLGVIVALGLAQLASRAAKKEPWLVPLDRGLGIYEYTDNPAGPTPVLIQAQDWDRAIHALRRNQFFAWGGKRLVSPPTDVQHLDTEISVYRSPLVTPRIADVKSALVEVLLRARIEARVAGVDVRPAHKPSPR